MSWVRRGIALLGRDINQLVEGPRQLSLSFTVELIIKLITQYRIIGFIDRMFRI
jgi:hypothetical protein